MVNQSKAWVYVKSRYFYGGVIIVLAALLLSSLRSSRGTTGYAPSIPTKPSSESRNPFVLLNERSMVTDEGVIRTFMSQEISSDSDPFLDLSTDRNIGDRKMIARLLSQAENSEKNEQGEEDV